MALLDVNESQLTATNEQGDIIFTITQLPDDVTHLSIHAKTIKPQDIDELLDSLSMALHDQTEGE